MGKNIHKPQETPEGYFPTMFIGKSADSEYIIYDLRGKQEVGKPSTLEELSEQTMALAGEGEQLLFSQTPREYFGITSGQEHPEYQVLGDQQLQVLRSEYEKSGPHFFPNPFDDQPTITSTTHTLQFKVGYPFGNPPKPSKRKKMNASAGI